MQFRTFCVSALTDDGCAELNTFLRSNRVLSVEKRFFDQQGKWLFCVEYLAGSASRDSGPRSKIDYREVLNDDDFAVYSALRELRKELADRDGVPIYAVFSNEQLAQMVERRVKSRSGLGEIVGIGTSKLDKYGEAFADRLKELLNSS